MRMYYKGVEYSKHEELLTTNMEGRTITVVIFEVEDGATFDTLEEMQRYIAQNQRREGIGRWNQHVAMRQALEDRKQYLEGRLKTVSQSLEATVRWLEGR